MSIRLVPEVARAVTYQSYAPQAAIDEVFYHPLTKHRALEGWFLEYLRLSEGQVNGLPIQFTSRQISFSRANPHRINAFHLHPKTIQDELWCVLDGTMLVWLVDCREGSPTLGVKRKYLLGGEAPALLYIPSGVAHGYKAGAEGALLVYSVNSQFNLQDPNEGRLTWDYFGSTLWADDRG
jgi:dTDP-4-dehydrorhamnose 3,5-epimerase